MSENDYICGNCEHPCGGRRHRQRSCVRRGAAGKSAWNGFHGVKKTDRSVWTFFLGLRNGWQGLKVLPRRTDGQRQGRELLPRRHDGRTEAWNPFQGIATVSAKGWNLFQGAFPAGEGLKSGSKGRRRPEEVKKPVPRRFTRRRRSSNPFQADAQRD